MSKPMSQVLNKLVPDRKPALVRLHQAITVGKAGVHAEHTLYSGRNTMGGIEFEESQYGMIATLRGYSFMVPWPNISHVEYETDNSSDE